VIAHHAAADMCRQAESRIHRLVTDLREDMATNDYWACHHPDATEDEIYAAGVVDGLGGEAGDFAALWTPGRAVAVADVLANAAVLLDALPDDVTMPSSLSLTVRLAEAFGGES
jgi:hypothetical protein